jgi:hypothetical protein
MRLPINLEQLLNDYSQLCNFQSRFEEDAWNATLHWLQMVSTVATQDRVIPYYAPNSSIKHSKSDSKDHSQEIL